MALRFAPIAPKRAHQWLRRVAHFSRSIDQGEALPIAQPLRRTGGISVAARMNWTVPGSRARSDRGPQAMHVKAARERGGMSEEQRLDFGAACDGRMSWRQYNAKWSRPTFG